MGDASGLEHEISARRHMASSSLSSGLGSSKPTAKATSFLSSRVLPVDALKIRNSMFVTQPMRSPAAAAVNVVMKEDVAELQDVAKYAAMENQIDRLHADFERGLA